MAARNRIIPPPNHQLIGLSPGNITNDPTTVIPFLAVATDVAGVAPLCRVSSVNVNAPK